MLRLCKSIMTDRAAINIARLLKGCLRKKVIYLKLIRKDIEPATVA